MSLRPMKVKKRPIPTTKLYFMLSEAADASHPRSLRSVMTTKSTPPRKIAASPSCQV